MSSPPEAAAEPPRQNRRLIALSAAAMYAAAGALSIVEGLTPGGASLELVPALVALAVAATVAAAGHRVPPSALFVLAPLGTAMIAWALARTPEGDGAVLYFWPVLWTAYFFGRRGSAAILVWIGAGHAIALHHMPAGDGYLDRWLDVMVVLGITAAVITKLSERDVELAEQLREEARIDLLTGLPNRRGFEERLALELARSGRNNESLALISFDIDCFKRVNDEWGHDVGDRVLARFGRLLAEHTREVDLAARIGGEEFVLLLTDSDEPAALECAERVRGRFAEQNVRDEPLVTVSGGVAAETGLTDLEPLLHRADLALYRAKQAGRNRIVPASAGSASGAVPAGRAVSR